MVWYGIYFRIKNNKNGWIAHIQRCQHDNAVLPWGPYAMNTIYNLKQTRTNKINITLPTCRSKHIQKNEKHERKNDNGKVLKATNISANKLKFV